MINCTDFEVHVIPTLYGSPSYQYKMLCAALGMISITYFALGFILFVIYKQKYVRLQSRSTYIHFCLSSSFVLLCVCIYFREYAGRHQIPCRVLLWIYFLAVYYSAGSVVSAQYLYIYKLIAQRESSNELTGTWKSQNQDQKSSEAQSAVLDKAKRSTIARVCEFISIFINSDNGKIGKRIPVVEEKSDNSSQLDEESAIVPSPLFSLLNEAKSAEITSYRRFHQSILLPTCLFLIIGLPIILAGIIRSKLNPIYDSKCNGCILDWVDYVIVSASLVEYIILVSIGLYKMRNENDPLGVLFEAKLGLICWFVFLFSWLLQATDPGHYYKDYKFTWDILFSIANCVLYFPSIYGHLLNSYLERRTAASNKKLRLKSTSTPKRTQTISTEVQYSSSHLPPVSALDINMILLEPRSRNALLEHCIDELSSENLLFVFKVRAWKQIWEKTQSSKVNNIAINIYREYVSRNSKVPINISNHTLSKIERIINPYLMSSSNSDNNYNASGHEIATVSPITSDKVPVNIFDDCESECIIIIKTDTLPRFRNSALFKERIIETGILGKILSQ